MLQQYNNIIQQIYHELNIVYMAHFHGRWIKLRNTEEIDGLTSMIVHWCLPFKGEKNTIYTPWCPGFPLTLWCSLIEKKELTKSMLKIHKDSDKTCKSRPGLSNLSPPTVDYQVLSPCTPLNRWLNWEFFLSSVHLFHLLFFYMKSATIFCILYQLVTCNIHLLFTPSLCMCSSAFLCGPHVLALWTQFGSHGLHQCFPTFFTHAPLFSYQKSRAPPTYK